MGFRGEAGEVEWTGVRRRANRNRIPAEARHFCSDEIAARLANRAGTIPQDAALIVSELVSNSVTAGADTIVLDLAVAGDTVRVSVSDDAEGTPQPVTAGLADGHGRGLAIVAALATRWAVDSIANGKRVWAELTVA